MEGAGLAHFGVEGRRRVVIAVRPGWHAAASTNTRLKKAGFIERRDHRSGSRRKSAQVSDALAAVAEPHPEAKRLHGFHFHDVHHRIFSRHRVPGSFRAAHRRWQAPNCPPVG